MILKDKGYLLITVLRWQLYMKDIRVNPLLFSQREGLKSGRVFFGRFWVEFRVIKSKPHNGEIK